MASENVKVNQTTYLVVLRSGSSSGSCPGRHEQLSRLPGGVPVRRRGSDGGQAEVPNLVAEGGQRRR